MAEEPDKPLEDEDEEERPKRRMLRRFVSRGGKLVEVDAVPARETR